jgi:ferritin-like metal-binding protein YciE
VKIRSWGECIVVNLKTLYVNELKDLLDAENQLVKALPKMAKATTSSELRSGIEHHLEQTKGMNGIIAEGKEILDEDYEGAVRDAGIISAAQRVEHYEIGAYGCVREYAQLLGENEAVSLLGQTLEEEKETDKKLSDLAHSINQQALGSERARTVTA